MGEGKLRERGEREEDRHGQRWETKLLALWDAFLLPSSLPPSVNGIPSFFPFWPTSCSTLCCRCHTFPLFLPFPLPLRTCELGSLCLLRTCSRSLSLPPSHSGLPLTIRKFRSQRKFFYDSSTSKIGARAHAKAVIFASRTNER